VLKIGVLGLVVVGSVKEDVIIICVCVVCYMERNWVRLQKPLYTCVHTNVYMLESVCCGCNHVFHDVVMLVYCVCVFVATLCWSGMYYCDIAYHGGDKEQVVMFIVLLIYVGVW